MLQPITNKLCICETSAGFFLKAGHTVYIVHSFQNYMLYNQLAEK